MSNSTLIFGQRSIWPGKSAHWEIRKGVTLEDYNSSKFQSLLKSQLDRRNFKTRDLSKREKNKT